MVLHTAPKFLAFFGVLICVFVPPCILSQYVTQPSYNYGYWLLIWVGCIVAAVFIVVVVIALVLLGYGKKKPQVGPEVPVGTADYILGPISLTHLKSNVYSQEFYVFGDYHRYDAVCQHPKTTVIDAFIEETIKANPEKTIDIFLEAGMATKDNPGFFENEDKRLSAGSGQGYLFSEVKARFAQCLRIDKKACEYANTRVHYSDARFMSKAFMKLVYASLALTQAAEQGKDQAVFASNCRAIRDAMSELPFNLGDMDAWLVHTKIQKQIDAIAEPAIVVALKKFIKSRDHVSSEEMSQVVAEIEKAMEEGATKDRLISIGFKFGDVYRKLWDQAATLIEAYLLARSLRTFTAGESPRNNIIYAGDNHCKRIVRFLTRELGFFVVDSVTSPDSSSVPKPLPTDDQQCLDIRTFVRPFFALNSRTEPSG